MMQSFHRAIALLGVSPGFLSQPGLALTAPLQPHPAPLSQTVIYPSSTPILDPTYPTAQGNQRMKDCTALQTVLEEFGLQYMALRMSIQDPSVTDSQAQLVINALLQTANRIRALPIQDSGVKSFQGRIAQVMGEFRNFAGGILDALKRQDRAKAEATANQFLQKLYQNADLSEQFQDYCQSGSMPSGSPASGSQSSGSQPSGTPLTGDLNTQLQQAVNAKNWTRSIQIVDQLIQQYPNRAEELKQYREQLVKLQNAR